MLLQTSGAWAYSYAAAGKEPLIEGRQALLKALAAGDQARAEGTVAELKPELGYLKDEFNRDYYQALSEAVNTGRTAPVVQVLDSAFIAEIERRLDGARQHFDNYQTAKVLVFKAKRFLDLVTPQLDAAARTQAEQAINKAMDALGNPGVFGVGQKSGRPGGLQDR